MIHLVSGFQVAGFPHIVGSIWLSEDQIYADMARLFYYQIYEVGEGMLVDGSVARALHSAVVHTRQQWWLEPLAWAQYIYYGA